MKLWEFIGNSASEIIALSALGLAIWQGVSTRRHNRLAVKPHLDFSSKYSDGETFTLWLKNDGIGPAIVKKYELFLDGVLQPNEGSKLVTETLKKLNTPSVSFGGMALNPNSSLAASTKQQILHYDMENYSKSLRKDFESEFKRIEIVIKYESLYGERFTAKYQFT
ncbi:hypothetical protein [Shewanella litoralis]|uniref:Uncharacterized protein n=1 Tax=Shewanella litoralis TaxID=2282700 RepID=A0ABQ2RH83_9GAMM|nr:hypothetical protein [Shewanella litoralis]GGQ30734.1 hypothetical protein GCM10009411_32940 [Shewanella litoralis]